MEVINLTRDKLLANSAKVASNFLTRLVGLLNRSQLPMGEGLIIKPCNAVHSCFMRFAIDVLFLDAEYRVVGIFENMEPYRFSKRFKPAVMVLELPVGVVDMTGTRVGDQLKLVTNIV